MLKNSHKFKCNPPPPPNIKPQKCNKSMYVKKIISKGKKQKIIFNV